MYLVLRREPFDQIVTVLIHPTYKIIGHADVQRAARATCKDVDVIWQARSIPNAGVPGSRLSRLKALGRDDN
jgi:hypothetical protein